MPIINGGDVAAFLGQGSDTTLVALAGEVAPVITAMVASYTRGRGFDDDEPNDELAAVITTASARLVANPNRSPPLSGRLRSAAHSTVSASPRRSCSTGTTRGRCDLPRPR